VSIINTKREKEVKTMLCCCEYVNDSNKYFKSLMQLGHSLRNNKETNEMLIFLNALSNQERFIIFNALKKRDRCVCELEVILNKSQPSISHHLRILEGAGIIRGWKKGKFTYYGIETASFRTKINDLIESLKL
jgi:DNA-binding transcriptional ArsR family regulator